MLSKVDVTESEASRLVPGHRDQSARTDTGFTVRRNKARRKTKG